MDSFEFPILAGQLGRHLGAEVVGDAGLELSHLSALSMAEEGALSYLSDKRFSAQLGKMKHVALFTTADLVRRDLPLTFLVVENPKEAFSGVARHFQRRPLETAIAPSAWIHPEAIVESGAGVGANAHIGRGAIVESGASVGPQCYLGERVRVGAGSVLYPRVTLLDDVIIGKRVMIFPGTVLGGDGFGFTPGGPGVLPREVPQIGTVVVEDDVRIGANCTVDRATIGETRIGRGTKIDNQVHIGHNVQIGERCLICAQVGIAGSVVIGDDAMLGGQAGISDNVHIGRGAKVGGAAAVFSHVDDGETVMMSPSMPKERAMPVLKLLRRLPEMWERLKALEARMGGRDAC